MTCEIFLRAAENANERLMSKLFVTPVTNWREFPHTDHKQTRQILHKSPTLDAE